MKKVIFGLMMLAMVSLLTGVVMAQKPKARDLYIEREKNPTQGKAGAKVRILLKRGNEKPRYVTPAETFYSGDRIKLVFDVNFSGYVALLNVGSSGKISLLYPYQGIDGAIEPSDKEQMIPGDNKDWIRFDDQAGTEQVTIVFSTNPIQSVQNVINMSGQGPAASAGTSVSAAANASTTVSMSNSGGGSQIYVASSAEAQAILQELNARSLKRSKSRDLYVETASNDATYAVAESSLITEPTAFVITLRHQNR